MTHWCLMHPCNFANTTICLDRSCHVLQYTGIHVSIPPYSVGCLAYMPTEV